MPADPVGVAEIAERAGVAPVTVRQWRRRHPTTFPPPRWTVSGQAAWDWPDIQTWLAARDRAAS